MFKISSLFSGSSGNSTSISSCTEAYKSYAGLSFESSNTRTRILIDSGVSAIKLEKAMHAIQENCTNLDGILLTHEHFDHVSGIGVAVRKYKIPLYVTSKTWMSIFNSKMGVIPENLLNIFNAGESFTIKNFEIESFPTFHDAADSVGYKIKYKNKSVSLISDTGCVDENILNAVKGSNAVFLESNYDEDMLLTGSYPWHLKNRINGKKGHLSNVDCAITAEKLLCAGTKYFILSHLSKENNTPKIAYKTTVDYITSKGGKIDKDYNIQVSPRYVPGKPWTI